MRWPGLRFGGVLVSAAVVIAGVPPAAAADSATGDEPVRYAVEIDFAPFAFVDDQGRPAGLGVEILNEVADQAGITLRNTRPGHLTGLLARAQRRRVDLLVAVRPTVERSRYLGFTQPFIEVPAVLVGGPDVGLAGIDGRRVAVGRDYAVESFVRSRYPQVHWVPTDNDAASLRAIGDGMVVAAVMDLASFDHNAAAAPEGVAPRSTVGYTYSLSYGFRSDRPDIGQRLSHGLREIPAERRQEIIDRWIPSSSRDIRSMAPPALLPVILAVAVLGMVLLAVSAIQRRRPAP